MVVQWDFFSIEDTEPSSYDHLKKCDILKCLEVLLKCPNVQKNINMVLNIMRRPYALSVGNLITIQD